MNLQVRCVYCTDSVNDSRIEQHIEDEHPDKPFPAAFYDG